VTSEREGFVGERSMGLGRFGDAILGAVMAGLVLALRRRLGWLRSAAQSIGPLGVGLSAMATITLAGGVLFGLRLVPGPAFTVGVLLTSLVIFVVERKRVHKSLVRWMPFPSRLDPLVVLGILVGAAGLAVAIHAAWLVDVTAVNNILRAVGTSA
jgi:hypothetical protein